MYNGKNVLVTGAGGFIGSHLAETLVKRGARVTAMVRYGSSGQLGNLDYLPEDIRKELQVVAGNVEDGDFMRRVVKGQDVVFHLAALIAIPYSYVAPRSYVRTNVEGTLNVLEAVRDLGVGRMVHTSTSEVYGTARFEPIDESHPLQGQSPYSASKIGADKLAESYYLSFATPVVTVRPFNTFGPRQSARAFIPTVISQAFDQPEIHLGSLDPQRDMTFVSDTVEGFLAAGLADGVEGEAINLGVGRTDSIGHIANKILELMKSEKKIVQDPQRIRPEKSEVRKLISNNSKAKKRLGWEPKVTLTEGLMKSIEFVREHRHIYRSKIYNL